jgi:hypothetical protein
MRRNHMISAQGPVQDYWCNRLWVLKNSLSRNSQKLHRVRMLYKRLSLFGQTFSIPQICPDF